MEEGVEVVVVEVVVGLIHSFQKQGKNFVVLAQKECDWVLRLPTNVMRLWVAWGVVGVVLTCRRQAEIQFHLWLALEEVVEVEEVVVDNLTPWEGIALMSAHCNRRTLLRVLLLLIMKKVEPEAKEAEEEVKGEVVEVELQQ